MEIDRRDFLRLGGVAAFACASGLGLSVPRRAYAVAGVDDALLGGLVLLVATLGGYAVSRSVANVSLDALGYGFSDFVSDSSHQAAAVTQAIADANNLGVELNRSNAENAAQSIAAGTGYFAEVMGNAATSGRVALDNFISGASELPGVLRNLVGNFIASETSASGARLLPGAVSTDLVDGTYSYDDLTFSNASSGLYVGNLNNMLAQGGINDDAATWCFRAIRYRVSTGASDAWTFVYGNVPIKIEDANPGIRVTALNNNQLYYQNNGGAVATGTAITLAHSTNNSYYYDLIVSGSLVSGSALPVVDRAADAPDVIGPGYDSVPLANDLVIDPNTDEVTSAGSLPLPQAIPDVFGDYVGTLEDLLAGVVPGMLGLPISTAEPVVVGTAEGVQSMPISEAVTTETTLAAGADVPVPTPPPVSPIEPPVDVPEGPWTPAITLPFEQLWPFNMIYSMVELFEQLGG